MAKLKSIFTAGVMDSETDNAYIKQGYMRVVENMRFLTNGGNDGVGVNIKGTREVADLTNGNIELRCIGAIHDQDKDLIYFMLGDDIGVVSKICEYDIKTDSSSVICEDNESVLAFGRDNFITGIDEIDGLLYWVQKGHNPRRINVNRAKGYELNGFTEEDITVIVKPPQDKLKTTLQVSEDQDENYIEEKFLMFSYQWRYLDGEYSSLAPFTNPAFLPKPFNYDFSEQSNRSMINAYNQVKLEFNTGNERVTEIRLVFKESESNTVWIIDDFNKAKMNLDNDVVEEFIFNNSKIYRALTENELKKYYSNVPREALAQTMIKGRLIYGNYLEGFDLKDDEENSIKIDYSLFLDAKDNLKIDGDPIVYNSTLMLIHTIGEEPYILELKKPLLQGFWDSAQFAKNQQIQLTAGDNSGTYIVKNISGRVLTLEKTSAPNPTFNGSIETTLDWTYIKYVPSLNPKRTAKSVRDYEVGILYADDFGRSTPVLVSKTNTLNIPISNSVTENRIIVRLSHKPPSFATNYRFFIKPSRRGYDQILPVTFYEDGVYRWIKLEGADKDKVKEGDYLIVKRDSQGEMNNIIKTKVLEVKIQEKNFLSTANESEQAIKEKSGLYFKIQPKRFRLSPSDFDNFYLKALSNYWSAKFTDIQPYISKAHFYGEGLNDVQSSGAYTGYGNTGIIVDNIDKSRYIITIDGEGTGYNGVDTFSVTENEQLIASEIDITGSAQLLSKGVYITFNSTTGHTLNDFWTVNARAAFGVDFRPYAYFRVEGEFNDTLNDITDERIYNGTTLNFKYVQEHETLHWEINITSSGDYDNIEEWFNQENVLAQIISQKPEMEGTNVVFVRGVLEKVGELAKIRQDDNGIMTLCIRSIKNGTSGLVFVESYSNVIRSGDQNIIVFETEGKETPSETFYEIGKTYKIENGLHKVDLDLFPTDKDQEYDPSQDNILYPLKVTLDWFNAYSYGNGVESYKIKDEFNRKGIDIGVRALTTLKDEFKAVWRKADLTWSDVYEDELSFNGLGSFNLSLLNFTKLDQEQGSIQRIVNSNGDLSVFQEDAIGLMPYNKQVIYDTQGNASVGVSTEVLDTRNYRPYAFGKFGTQHPESIVSYGNRRYVIDQARGVLLRISNNGATPLDENLFDAEFTRLMKLNNNKVLLGGFDPQTGEYLVTLETDFINNKRRTLIYNEKGQGFAQYLTMSPDFMLNADNDLYLWKNGIMYRANDLNHKRNNFFGQQEASKVKFIQNDEFPIEKIWKSIGIESTHSWYVSLKTKLTSRKIDKTHLKPIEDYWYSDIMGNTNNNLKASATFGLGQYPINNGIIQVNNSFPSLSIGDRIMIATNERYRVDINNPQLIVVGITSTEITLNINITTPSVFLMYRKNQNLDGASIRGNILEVELINDDTEKVEIRAVSFEVSKSENTN